MGRRREPVGGATRSSAAVLRRRPDSGRHRRFFDIDDLAALRQEDEEVFTTTHAKGVAVVPGVVDGLRIDHTDGMADQAGYLARWPPPIQPRLGREDPPRGEPLRRAVDGTVGYEFLNEVRPVRVARRRRHVHRAILRHQRRPALVRRGRGRGQAPRPPSRSPRGRAPRRAAERDGLAVTTDDLVDALSGLGVYRNYVRAVARPPRRRRSGAIDAAGMSTDGPRPTPGDGARSATRPATGTTRSSPVPARPRGRHRQGCGGHTRSTAGSGCWP